LDVADVVKKPVNAVRLCDQIEQRQIVYRDNLIRRPIVPDELAGVSMCHAVRFRGFELLLPILFFAAGGPAIQFMNRGPAFCNRLTGAGLIPAVLWLVTLSPGRRMI
jgi:hypothetical protein